MGIQTDREQRKWEEGQQDELIKMRCLELVLKYGAENHKLVPWRHAQKHFMWVKIGNPDAEVK